MHRLTILLLITCILLLTGCVTSTPYQPKGLMGGYSEMQLNQHTYVVNFDGNEDTPREQIDHYLLIRAAELTAQNGYRYFTILGYKPNTNVRYVTTPTIINNTNNAYYNGLGTAYAGNYNLYGTAQGSSQTIITPGTTYTRESHSSSIMIRMLSKPNPSALDARIILKHHPLQDTNQK